MVTLIIVLLLLEAFRADARASDWESAQYNAEMRHQELLSEVKSIHEEVKKGNESRKSVHTKGQRKRAIKDANGNVLIEEVLVDSLEGIRT